MTTTTAVTETWDHLSGCVFVLGLPVMSYCVCIILKTEFHVPSTTKTPAITISPGAEGCNLVPRALHLFLLSLRPRVFVKRLPLLWVLLKECRTLFLFMFYLYLVQPYLPDYCSVVWGNSLQCMHFGLSEKPQKLQNRAARILISCSRHSAGVNLVIKD